jgi:hypothetical protein
LVITITAPRTENAESQGWTAAKQFLGSVDPIKVDLVNVEGAQAQLIIIVSHGKYLQLWAPPQGSLTEREGSVQLTS